MGCEPTVRKRTLTPACQIKVQDDSGVSIRKSSMIKRGSELKDNSAIYDNIIESTFKSKENKRPSGKMKSTIKGSPPQTKDLIKEDVIVKEQRRPMIMEKMNFANKDHLKAH